MTWHRHCTLAVMLSAVAVLLATLFSVSPAQAQSTPAADAELAQRARAVIEQLDRSEYSPVFAMFSDKLKAAFPEKKLRETWEKLRSRSGRVVSTADPIFKSRDPLQGVIVPTTFTNKKQRSLEIVFNPAGQIAGFLVH
jgi:hypothetical protein